MQGFVFFSTHSAACGILAPPPDVKPLSSAVEVQSLNHWTPREDPEMLLPAQPWSTTVAKHTGSAEVYSHVSTAWLSAVCPSSLWTIHFHLCTNLTDIYFRIVCGTRWKQKWTRPITFLYVLRTFSGHSLLWLLPIGSYPLEFLAHSRFWLSRTRLWISTDTFITTPFFPFLCPSSWSLQPPGSQPWPPPDPACLCHLYPLPPPWLCLLASFQLPLVHDHQLFKACATCPFSSHQSGTLPATFREVHLSV